jgi:Ser/Thr protein kinase RdoA (MazF antagonist)
MSRELFARLSPDLIMDAIESLGYQCDARILELNSYENRVFQIGLEQAEPIIAKFYRANRWTDDMIREEHDFTLQLVESDVSVVPPMQIDSQTLFVFDEFRFSLYQRRGGRAPAIDDLDCLTILGRHIALIHNVGASSDFNHRPALSIEEFGLSAREFLLSNNFIPMGLIPAYSTVSEQLLADIEKVYAAATFDTLRLHGDCHMGNVLWREELPHFVDFDDARTGPAIQDLWMMLSGSQSAQEQQLDHILKGYREFRDFNPIELRLIEGLRALRLMHHAAWIARRWQEPAFKRAFPFFDNEKFWATHILELREQCAALFEQPLQLIY